MLDEMKALVKEKFFCVLATVSGGEPHCSLMSYAVDEECREIYMITLQQTKKYRNLLANDAVSLLIDTRGKDSDAQREKIRALTVNGVFRRIEDEGKKEAARARLFERHPDLKEFADHPEAEVFVVKVQSFQLLNGITDSYFETVA